MRIRTIAKSSTNSCIGTDADGNCYVFTFDGYADDVNLGDILRGTFDDSDGLAKWVQNETQGVRVYVYAETWECSAAHALEMLRQLGNPEKIWTL